MLLKPKELLSLLSSFPTLLRVGCLHNLVCYSERIKMEGKKELKLPSPLILKTTKGKLQNSMTQQKYILELAIKVVFSSTFRCIPIKLCPKYVSMDINHSCGHQLIYFRQRVTILQESLVQISAVNAYLSLLILFWNHNCKRRLLPL